MIVRRGRAWRNVRRAAVGTDTGGSDDGDRRHLPDAQLIARRPWYFLGVGLIVLSAVLRQPLLVIAGVLLCAIGLIPDLWYRFCLAGVEVEQHLSEQRVLFGETVAFTLTLENRKALPLPWIEVEDEFPEELPPVGTHVRASFRAGRVVLTSTLGLWLYQRVKRRYTLRCTARGIYSFGPVTLHSGDPFGLLRRDQRVDSAVRLIVYPLVVPVARLGLPPLHPFGERTAPRRLLEDPLRIAGVRPYMVGDEPRRIHWKATARTGAPQSKIYEPATRHTLALFVDVRTLENPVLGYDPELFELTACAAASVAAWAAEQRFAVGVYSNGTLLAPGESASQSQSTSYAARIGAVANGRARHDDQAVRGAAALRLRVPPSSNTAQLTRVLEALARVSPFMGRPIERVIAAEQATLPYGTTVVYVGTAATLGAAGIAALRRLRAHGHAATLLLVGNAPLEVRDLNAYRLGGKEMWDALMADALAENGDDGARRPRAPLKLA